MVEWKVCSRSPFYEVSETGQVRNAITLHLLKPAPATNGYLTVVLGRAVGTVPVHRLVAESFLGIKGECVNHIDGNKLNNTLTNLEWVSRRENNVHALKTQLRVGRLLLSEKRLIADLQGVQRAEDIAEIFGIDRGTVFRIWKRSISLHL